MTTIAELERSEVLEVPEFLRPEARGPRRRPRAVLGRLAAVGAIAALVQVHDAWAAQAALVGLLLGLPGLLLLRALRVPGEAIARFPLYVPGASLIVLMASGLAVDLVGPELGAQQPLRTGPLLIGLEAVCLLLLAAGLRVPSSVNVPWRAVGLRVWHLWPLLLPAGAALGAARLTSGHGTAVAVATLAAGGVALFGCTLAARHMSRPHLAMVLYGIGLATVWSFSLRGGFVYGFDIATEYHVFTSTQAAGVWKSTHSADAYGAMLSLTILPSVLQEVAGVTPLVVLKAVFPALFALLPVGVFALASRVLHRRYAFLAAGFLVVQSNFFQQLPAIARQEIALLLFVVLVAAMLDDRLPRRAQWPLVALVAFGIVVSHYSTTYLAIAIVGVAVVIQLALSVFGRVPRVSGGVVAALVALGIGAVGWYGPVTHSSSNAEAFSLDLRDRGLDLLPNAKPGQSLIQTYLTGNTQRRVTPAEFQRLVIRKYRAEHGWVRPLPAARDPAYALAPAAPPAGKPNKHPWLSQHIQDVHLPLAQLVNALALLGAFALALSRRAPPLARRIAVLGLGTLLVLAFLRLSGTAAQAYNQERAFLQTMVPLSIALAWLLQAGAGAHRLGRLGRGAVRLGAAVALLAIYVNATGLRPGILGGGAPTNVADRGEDYERFYLTRPELAGARWLGVAAHNNLTYADRYGSLRVLGATGRYVGVLQAVTPPTLDRSAWIYASRANGLGRARGEVDGKYTLYAWPQRYLGENYATVYANGSSSVYHR